MDTLHEAYEKGYDLMHSEVEYLVTGGEPVPSFDVLESRVLDEYGTPNYYEPEMEEFSNGMKDGFKNSVKDLTK